MNRIYLNRILQHLIFWISLWIFQALIDASYSFDFSKYLIIQSLRLPAQVFIAYFNIYYLLPNFLLRKKYAQYLSLIFLSMIVAGFLQRLSVHYLINPLYSDYCTSKIWAFYPLFYDIFSLYPVVALTTAIKLLRRWYKDQTRNQELERERLDAELKFLKTQIHPHFFFNTLNNLYALTLIKSDDAPEVVLKLSGLMDYLLYESNTHYVTLSKEVEHLENYLALEKLRFGSRLDLKFNIAGDIRNKYISPMLVLPFLENSFKHGVSESLNNSWVKIALEVVGYQLNMVIENSKSNQEENEKQKNCIGLKNVLRRLELLYPENHNINIINQKESFKVELQLNLAYIFEPYEDKMSAY